MDEVGADVRHINMLLIASGFLCGRNEPYLALAVVEAIEAIYGKEHSDRARGLAEAMIARQ